MTNVRKSRNYGSLSPIAGAAGLAAALAASTPLLAAEPGQRLPTAQPAAQHGRTAMANPCKSCQACKGCRGCKSCKGCKAAEPCAANPCAANPCAGNPCAGTKAEEVSDEQAAAAYAGAKASMAMAYAKSGSDVAKEYQGWQLYNTAPYVSSTHGERRVNNYANDRAANYGEWEDAGVMPEGAIIAKDSLNVGQDGGAQPGPMFIMQKMPEGFAPEFGNWRYTLITPNGQIMGETGGRNSDGVQFCAECHMAAEDQDHLFFLPEEYRRAV